MRISDWSSDVCSSDLGRRISCCKEQFSSRKRPSCRSERLTPSLFITIGNGRRCNGQTGKTRNMMTLSDAFSPWAIQSIPISMSCAIRSEEHTSELQSLMRTTYAVLCFKTKIPKMNSLITGINTTVRIALSLQKNGVQHLHVHTV